MSSFDLYIFDLDGTLYRGREVISAALTCVKTLANRGAAIAYLTNNSGATIGELGDRLTQMGYPVTDNSVWNSGYGATQYLVEHKIDPVFVVGEAGLFETLELGGIRTVNSPDDPLQNSGAAAVLVGICRSATYAWIDAAMQAIRAGAGFIACNPDPVYPLEGGRLQPGAGTLVAAIQTCSETEPILIGKPEPTLILQIIERLGISKEKTLVIGDREDTDIEAARRAGVVGALVKGAADYREILEF